MFIIFFRINLKTCVVPILKNEMECKCNISLTIIHYVLYWGICSYCIRIYAQPYPFQHVMSQHGWHMISSGAPTYSHTKRFYVHLDMMKLNAAALYAINTLSTDALGRASFHFLHTIYLNIATSYMLLNGIDGLVQDCSNYIALAMELLQSCTKPSVYVIWENIGKNANIEPHSQHSQ